MLKKLLLTCFTVMALFVTAVGVAGPASAATCSGSGCTGKDPNTYGCSSDAYTLIEMTYRLDRMEMRYSPKCNAVWTRCTTGNIYTVNNSAAIIWYQYGSHAYSGKYTVTCSNAKKGDVKWTKMVIFTGHYLRTCGKNYLLLGGDNEAGDWKGDNNATCTAER